MTAPDASMPPPVPPGLQPPVGPVHLPSLDDTEHADAMRQLRDWVDHLIARFDITARVIPPCWDRHNGMVEALLALRDLERDCYNATAPASAGVDWFRGYREIETRLIELAALTNCSVHEHRTPPRAWDRTQTQSDPAATRHTGPSVPPETGGAPAQS